MPNFTCPVRRVVSRLKVADCFPCCTIRRMLRRGRRQGQRSLRKSDAHAQRSLQATAQAAIFGVADLLSLRDHANISCDHVGLLTASNSAEFN